ncbi:MAG: arylsulfatase [Bacteroidota bacterium]
MKHFILTIILHFFTFFSFYAQEDVNKTPPNVILIVVDDMGWNDVSYHGSEIQTPTIDQLAAEGVELNRFYAHSTCTPTRSSLMTGKTSLRLGIVNPIAKNNVLGLPLSEKIMPQYFKEKGYATYLVGKWHLGRFKKEYWPYNRGFDHFYGNLTGGIGHYDHVHGGALDWQRDGKTLEEEGYTTHLLTDETIRILKAKNEKPLFLELCYAAPHMPNEAPAEIVAEYQHIKNKNRQLHAAMITEMDRGIQKIIATLEETGLIENTIIWFMSDNGGKNLVGTPEDVAKPILNMAEIWGEPLPFPFWEFLRDNMVNGAGDNRPFKGGKATVYEGGLRVPAFIYAPNFIPQQKVDHRITVNDVLPTLATAIGVNELGKQNLDGVSQWQFLKKEVAPPVKTFVSAGKWNQAIFKDEWKLIFNKEGETELYKIFEDPTEQTNLSDQFPAVVATLKAELLGFPKGASIDDPLWKVFLDSDQFGGKIDREPFAGKEGNVSGPIHRSFYIVGIIGLIIIILFTWLMRKLIKYIIKN